jgi:hypothetical protein
MSRPVNIDMPCGGDAFKPYDTFTPWSGKPACCNCDLHYSIPRRKCLGADGWPILALAAAEVARERAVTP